MKHMLAVLGICVALQAGGAVVSQEVAVGRAVEWMASHPVMGKTECSVASVEMFPTTGTGYSVYVVRLSPAGYLVLNSDDRLPLVVCFSAESGVDLSDVPENTFRAMLLSHVERMTEKLAEPDVLKPQADVEPLAVTELHGPFLETTWNQCNPYNKLCPEVANGLNGYGGRAPVGCVPTAYAQVLNFHGWPFFGQGLYSYTDADGLETGTHSATFSDTYDWASMQTDYSVFGSNPVLAENAVSELMYELGVAAEADYESNGTAASVKTLGSRLGEHLFFEPNEYHSTLADLRGPMETDLRAGFPCVVSVPGHAIVADGLMVDGGATTYHFNYGWGGSNNGWFDADAISVSYGTTALRPRLMAFPQSNAVAGEAGGSVELHWILPKRRQAEVAQLAIHRLEQQTGNWQSDASEITAGTRSGWDVVSAGHSGDCWFAGPNGPASMLLDEVFVPDASASLTFWKYVRLYTSSFSIEVSVDDGMTFDTLFSTVYEDYDYSWSQESISLAAYAGQSIRLRFSLSAGGWYTNGGIWLDDLAMTSGGWLSWQPFSEGNLAAGSSNVSTNEIPWDECADFSEFELTSTSTKADWVVSTSSGVDHCFYKQPGGIGSKEYHLTSFSSISPVSSTRLMLRAKYNLASDQFRVLLSTDRSFFSEIWTASGTVDWSDIAIDLSAYAGQAVYVRLEYVVGTGAPDGGIWIDSIGTQEITTSAMEGSTTVLTNLPAGQHVLAAVLTDINSLEHGLAPAFTLTVSSDDADGDGMPNDWENLYGLNPNVNDADLDPDGDGYSNLEEYICGTVPTNAASCWLLEAGAGNLPAFYAMEERFYTIQYRTNLVSGSWMSLTANIPGSNGVVEVDDYDSEIHDARFYRVQVQPAD